MKLTREKLKDFGYGEFSQWGRHSRDDLLPLRDLGEAVGYAKDLVRASNYNEAIGLLLGLKLLDEGSDKDLLFRITEEEIDEIEPRITNLALAFELDKAWESARPMGKDELQKIVMAWQPYGFLPQARIQGVFSLLSTLLLPAKESKYRLTEEAIRLIHALLAGSLDPVGIAGPGASSLLDISLLGAKSVEMIGPCHPAIHKLGQTLLCGFKNLPEDFLSLTHTQQWSDLVCLPPFHQKLADSKLLAGFELADRGKGKRVNAIDAETLWLERSHQLLSEDGFLVILLTDGILSNASSFFIREWVQAHFQVDSIFSLPASAFHSGASIKASLVCLRKRLKRPLHYRIFMAELGETDLDDLSSVIQAYRAARQEDGQ